MHCGECKAPLLTNYADKDRGMVVCDSCGLVVDNLHPMGRGVSGLMLWLKAYGIRKPELQVITEIYITQGLKNARLASIELRNTIT